MARTAKVLRYTTFTMTAIGGVAGGLFVAGNAFDDPGGWAAVGMTALWAVPLVGLTLFALLRPAAAEPVFVALTTLVVVLTLADSAFGIVPRAWGPVDVVTVFVLAVTLAFLGLHRAGLAGLLMVVTAIEQAAAAVLGAMVSGPEQGPGAGAMLGGSSGVVVVPVLVVGMLFLLAGALDHEPSGRGEPPICAPSSDRVPRTAGGRAGRATAGTQVPRIGLSGSR